MTTGLQEHATTLPFAGIARLILVAVLLGGCESGSAAPGKADGAAPPPGATPDASPACALTVGQGALAGKVVGTTCEYLGIPYAQPPVGPLRFASPAPAAGWSGVRDATRPGAWCIQSPPANDGNTYSEDCLFLNVYAPAALPGQTLPVMVFIHGGAFQAGSGNEYDGRALAESGPAVVVTLNYRLGALGFFAMPGFEAERGGVPSGNDALRDQQLALRWVANNVAAFGGDPSRVTVFGESAGAISTNIHLVSPGSRGLARRYILESGVAVVPGTVEPQAQVSAVGQLLAGAFCADGGAPEGGDRAAACLRGAEANALMAWSAPASLQVVGASFGPIVDGAGGVLPDLPLNLIAAGQFDPSAEILVGSNEYEYGLLNELTAQPTSVSSVAQLDGLLELSFGASLATQFEALYPVPSDADAQSLYLTMLTDYFFRCPTRQFARAVTASGTKSLFLYTYDVGRAYHTDELLALFDIVGPFFSMVTPPATVPSAGFRAKMQRYWTEFAATGDPNDADAGTGAWPVYASANEALWTLADPTPGPGVVTNTAVCDFWQARNYATSGP